MWIYQGFTSRGGAMAALLLLLLPVFFPTLFTTFISASPSILSWVAVEYGEEWLQGEKEFDMQNLGTLEPSSKVPLQRETTPEEKRNMEPCAQTRWKPVTDSGLLLQ
nr:GDP-fucose protein O-fucosyltransferase protein [Ipomoea batatas]